MEIEEHHSEVEVSMGKIIGEDHDMSIISEINTIKIIMVKVIMKIDID